MSSFTHPITVIGGGFYGCSIAEHLASQGEKVILFEQDTDLLSRASYNNQARLHGGYHYPRSFTTAYRSRLNFNRFLQDYKPAICSQFTKLYAIARTNSKVSPRQFETFCQNIEAPLRPAAERYQKLFSPRLISGVYETEEYAFNAATLRSILAERLQMAGVEVNLNTKIIEIRHTIKGNVLEVIDSQDRSYRSNYVFNCTYSGLNNVRGVSTTQHLLKHEITELALVELPHELGYYKKHVKASQYLVRKE